MNYYTTQSNILKALSHPTRLAILDILREGEQCVCHMEAILGQRQAYISQQLMVLKNAELIEPRRDGLNLYYRVIQPEIYTVLDAVAAVTGTSQKLNIHNKAAAACPCPRCSAEPKQPLIQLTSIQNKI